MCLLFLPGIESKYPLRTVRRRGRFCRDAGDGFEDAMEGIAAHAGSFGERVEARQCLGVCDAATGLLHGHRVLFGERRRVWTAPFARPKAGLFGCFAGRIELHVVPIAAYHGRPPLLIVRKRR